jgi:hypothetical protein
MTIGDVRLVSVDTIRVLLKDLGNPPGFEIPFLNCTRVPILRLPSGDFVDLDVLSLCLACALSPAQPNLVIPPATPPTTPEQVLTWRYRLSLDDLASGLHTALSRILSQRGHPFTFPQRDALLRAARRFVHCADGLRPLLLLKTNDDAILDHLRASFSHDTSPPKMTVNDPWRPNIQRDAGDRHDA